MSKRGYLTDELGWRIRLLNDGFLFMASDIAEPNRERIMDDLGMLALEMWQIIEGNGIEENEPGHEGPLGPLPDGILK